MGKSRMFAHLRQLSNLYISNELEYQIRRVKSVSSFYSEI